MTQASSWHRLLARVGAATREAACVTKPHALDTAARLATCALERRRGPSKSRSTPPHAQRPAPQSPVARQASRGPSTLRLTVHPATCTLVCRRGQSKLSGYLRLYVIGGRLSRRVWHQLQARQLRGLGHFFIAFGCASIIDLFHFGIIALGLRIVISVFCMSPMSNCCTELRRLYVIQAISL